MNDSMEQIVKSCHLLLNEYPEAQETKDYLDSRLSQESQIKWQLGYFPNLKNIQSLIDMVGEEVLMQAKVLYARYLEDSWMPRKIFWSYFDDYPMMVPYRNSYGYVVGLMGRSVLSDHALKKKKIDKYKNTKETDQFKKGNLLFGLYENKKSIMEKGCVYLVEGQFDVMKAGEIGLSNIVGLGTSNMTPWAYSVITRYTNNIFLLLDNDDGGKSGRERIIRKFGHLANVRNFYIPEEYKDIDQYIREGKIRDYTELDFVVKD
jgi:DNA primase catalytic core